jgi:RND family efflux transporter MFP subunit
MKKLMQNLMPLIVTFLIVACSGKKQTKESFLRPIKYQQVGYLGGEKVRTFSGTAETDKIINLSFRNTGIVTQFDIKLGQKVKKGEQLARLDNVAPRLAYEQSLTQLNSAESQMNTAKLSLNRVRSLYEKGSASLSDFEAAKNAYKTAKEGYNSAKRGVDIQKEQVQYGYIYAPEDGVIAAVYTEVDENVNPGQTVATLNSGTDMEITLGIPESSINGIKEGMNVEVDFSSLQGQLFKAKVTEVSPAVDPSTATYPVRVTVTNPSDAIKSGMAANVRFNFGSNTSSQSRVLVVPANAVGEDSNGRFVFLIQENDSVTVVKKQNVTVGQLSAEGFQITSGLSYGQKIATAGLQTLLDGQKVKMN